MSKEELKELLIDSYENFEMLKVGCKDDGGIIDGEAK